MTVATASFAKYVDSKVDDMRFDIIYAVWNRYADMRKPKYETVDSVEAMLEYTAGEQPEAGVSDEYLLMLNSTYRTQSEKWKSEIARDSQFGALEVAEIERDQLHLAYRRWEAKRDINLLLSQLLGAELRAERVDNVWIHAHLRSFWVLFDC